MHRSLLVIIAALTAVSAWAQPSLTPHSAEYDVKISVLGGRLKTQLTETDEGFLATHTIKATGMSRLIARGHISESSTFHAVDDGIRPTRYTSDDTLTRDKTKADIEFDWAAGEARGLVNGQEFLAVMQDLAHDRVSIQYELMHDLLNDSPSAEYTMFEIDELRPVNVRNIGKREIKVPAGKFEAVGIQHQAQGSKRITTLWCVPELDYLPVVIEQHRKGKLRVRATLRKYTPVTEPQAVRLER